MYIYIPIYQTNIFLYINVSCSICISYFPLDSNHCKDGVQAKFGIRHPVVVLQLFLLGFPYLGKKTQSNPTRRSLCNQFWAQKYHEACQSCAKLHMFMIIYVI